MDPDEVDEPVLDQGQVLTDVDIELAHRQRDRRLLPQQREVAVVFRRQRILEKEEAVGLQRAGHADRHDRRHPFVDIVEQLDLVAERETQMFEEGRDSPRVGAGVPRLLPQSEMRRMRLLAVQRPGDAVGR
jgi:hypothetical protein